MRISPVRRLPAALLFLALAAAAPVGAQAPDGRLELETFLDFERVGDPRLSPDESSIIYTRGWVDRMADSWESSLWIMDADGSRNRFLVDGSSARWSPDGTRIAYTARGEPTGSQIFVRWMDGEGAVSQITRVQESPGDIAWSPDGEWLAFTMLVPDDADPDWRVSVPGRPEGAKWTEQPRIITALNFRRDRQGFYEQGDRHVFVVPADGGTPRQVSSGAWSHSSPRWLPDGKTLVFSSLRTEDSEYAWRESELYAVDVASGQIRQLTSRKGPDYGPAPSPDGRHIAYMGYDYNEDTYVVPQLWVMNADGSNPRLLSGAVDERAGSPMWAADGSGVYFGVAAEGREHLWFAPLNGQARQLTRGMVQVDVTDVGRRLAVGTRTSPHAPDDVVALDLRAREPRVTQLTRVNDDILAGVELGEVEEIWYPSVGGERIQGWIVKPPRFDAARKYPLMLSIHGGP
ncbi:MAG TPA: DPP IV N-terminal domain-containing protein, partial [Longimicrobiales bacterium]|nr:DPP IV N-terminal domain-containing protein [Longimicrobiales bacterium]